MEEAAFASYASGPGCFAGLLLAMLTNKFPELVGPPKNWESRALPQIWTRKPKHCQEVILFVVLNLVGSAFLLHSQYAARIL